jgi:hypothetical protein
MLPGCLALVTGGLSDQSDALAELNCATPNVSDRPPVNSPCATSSRNSGASYAAEMRAAGKVMYE